MGILDILSKAGQVKADADQTMVDFDSRWLVGAIGAQLKKGALTALAAHPKLAQLAQRLGTDEAQAAVLWNAFLMHLKEDF